jgi:histidyl-tRNA synthetase
MRVSAVRTPSVVAADTTASWRPTTGRRRPGWASRSASSAPVDGPELAEVYVASVDDAVRGEAFTLACALRDAGVATEIDHQGRSLKSQFKQADKLGAHFVLVVGPDELAAGEVTLRDMHTKDESRVAVSEAARAVCAALGR